MDIENKSGDAVITVTESQTKSTFYYGWVIVLLGALSVTISTGLIIGVLPILYGSYIKEFEWTRVTISFAGMIALFTRGITGVFTGWLWDRYGVKRFISPAIAVFGVALVLGAWMSSKSHFYAMIFVIALSVTLCGLGPCYYLASNWFEKKRGIALGIIGMGASIGGVIFPPITAKLLLAYEWRVTMAIYGSTAILIFSPLIYLFIKDRPSDKEKTVSSQDPNINEQTEINRNKILTSWFFWALVVGTSLCYVPIFTVPQHLFLHLRSEKIGFELMQAGWALSTIFLFSLIGRVIFGYLSDRFQKRIINLACTLIFVAGMLVLLKMTASTVWIFCALFGLGYSGITVTGKLVLAERFGVKSLGKLLGIMTGIETILGGAGSFLMGKTYDATKSYDLAFMIMVGCTFAATILMALLLVKPVSKVSSA